jgi:hypothetical protein
LAVVSFQNLAKFYQIFPVFPIENAICTGGLIRIYHPERRFAAKTSLAVSSMEYCGCLFDERDIWIRLGGPARG